MTSVEVGQRDLVTLVVDSVGAVVETDVICEPYRLVDPGGGVVVSVTAFLHQLQASGRSASRQSSYPLDLREHLIDRAVTLCGDGGDRGLLEAVLRPARGRRVRRDASQRPAREDVARTRDRRRGRDLAGAARRPRSGPGLVRAAGADPTVRDLTRARTAITRERGREAQRLEKLLEDAGIKLSAVASDILGVSARAMLEALIADDHDPAALADLAKRRLRSKIPALTGS
jgi:hypothetical protein